MIIACYIGDRELEASVAADWYGDPNCHSLFHRMMVIPQGPPAQRRYHLDKLEAQVNDSFMDSATTEGAPPPTAPPPLTSNEVESPPDASPMEDGNNSDVARSPPDKNLLQCHSAPQGYQCKLCTLVVPSQSALEEHMNIHAGSRPFHCMECGFSYSLQSTLNQHLATHHQAQKDDKFNVHSAMENQSFDMKMEHLKDESLTDHAPTTVTTTASLQNDNLPTSGMVTSPVTTAAPPLQQLPTLPAVVPPSFHEHSKVFQCKLCTHISPTKTHLNEHINVHSGKKPYKCLVCGFSSAFRSSLMRHLIVHTGTSKQYKCDQCHYQTPYKCNLQAHRRKRHSNSDHNNINLSGYPASHNTTSPIHSNPANLLQIQDPSKLVAHVGENNLDIRNHYPVSADALNSFMPASAAAALNSGNRPQPPSPNGSNTSASNDTQEMFTQKNSTPGSEAGDHPPVLEKNASNSNESSEPKDGMEYSGAMSINNDMSAMASASPTAPILSAALPGGPLGLLPGTLPPGSLPRSQHGEISVITPLEWASAGFPICRRKKKGGARKRKRTPVSKREFLVSPTGEDLTDTGRDSVSGGGGDNPFDIYRNMARDYAMKGDLTQGAVNGGMGLSRDSSYADVDGKPNNVSPSSEEQTKDEGMHSPGSGIGISTGYQQGSQLTRSTQTDQSNLSEGQSQSSYDLASQLSKCLHCDTFFADHVIFTLHMSCHGQRHPYQCSICSYVCRDKIEFTCHITRSQHK